MFELDGLDEWIAKLERIKVEFPEEIEKEIIKLANKLLRKVKQRTPVGVYSDGRTGGELRRNWQIGNLVKLGNSWYIEVFNNTEYAKHVEFGHRTRLGVTNNPQHYKAKGSIAYVPGVHMLKISVEELNSQLPGELKRWINRVIGE
ncbi:HK97 gp10 family phage protein [Clostridium botulinum]|nr:HK97 gp10 family phage protein [Clostridium botulinum]